MPYNIEAGDANFTLHISNSAAGASANSSCSFGLEWSGSPNQADFNRVSNLFRDALKPLWDNSWAVGPTHMVHNDAGILRVWDDTTTEAGTAVSSVYTSPAVALVVTKQTGLLGKGKRGRIYLPGLAESDVDEGGSILSGSVTARQTIFDALFTAVVADAAVQSWRLLHDIASPDNNSTLMTNFLVRGTVGTMRPRQRR